MPLHSVQRLSPAAVLGLWQLTETPAELWPLLPAGTYQPLAPTSADGTRLAQWLAGRVLIHALVREWAAPAGTSFAVQNDATGRPWLAGADRGLSVSLSHSGAWVAAVLAQSGRVGVDVEIIRDKAERLAAKFLAAEEWAAARTAVAHLPDAGPHYTLLWSAKETLYKLAGRRGIIFKQQLLLDAFSPEQSGKIPATLVLDGFETRHCVCYSRPAPGYVLTYCHETPV